MTSATAVIQLAKRLRDDGDHERAEEAYAKAARLASEEGAEDLKAHALRHLAELAAERGDGKQSLEAANEAVTIYRRIEAGSLNLANALRVRALAYGRSSAREKATEDWQSARALYRELGVEAGVAECDRRLEKL